MRQGKCLQRPTIKLVGQNGNAFNVLGIAISAAREAGWPQEEIDNFKREAMSGDYDNLLQVCMDYFDVI